MDKKDFNQSVFNGVIIGVIFFILNQFIILLF